MFSPGEAWMRTVEKKLTLGFPPPNIMHVAVRPSLPDPAGYPSLHVEVTVRLGAREGTYAEWVTIDPWGSAHEFAIKAHACILAQMEDDAPTYASAHSLGSKLMAAKAEANAKAVEQIAAYSQAVGVTSAEAVKTINMLSKALGTGRRRAIRESSTPVPPQPARAIRFG